MGVPPLGRFDDLSDDLGDLYGQAKAKHAKGIQILVSFSLWIYSNFAPFSI